VFELRVLLDHPWLGVSHRPTSPERTEVANPFSISRACGDTGLRDTDALRARLDPLPLSAPASRLFWAFGEEPWARKRYPRVPPFPIREGPRARRRIAAAPLARRGGRGTQSTASVTGWCRGQSPTLPYPVTQEEAEKDECNHHSSGQHFPGASACRHRPILTPSLAQVDRRPPSCPSP